MLRLASTLRMHVNLFEGIYTLGVYVRVDELGLCILVGLQEAIQIAASCEVLYFGGCDERD